MVHSLAKADNCIVRRQVYDLAPCIQFALINDELMPLVLSIDNAEWNSYNDYPKKINISNKIAQVFISFQVQWIIKIVTGINTYPNVHFNRHCYQIMKIFWWSKKWI
jgi:hypothetical protein